MSRMEKHTILFLLLQTMLACHASATCENQPPAPACGKAPFAIFDTRGQLLVVFVHGQHVYLSSSSDAGSSYDSTVQINREPEDIYADGENRPVLALGLQGQIYIAWTRQNSSAYSGDIRFSRSLDAGKNFEPIRTVNDDGLLTSHRFVAMLTSQSGTLYLAWLDKRDQVAALAAGNDYTGAALYYTFSLDAGRTFAVNRRLADHSCECCRLALAPSGPDAAKVLWRHVFAAGKLRDHAITTLDTTAPQPAAQPLRATVDDWYLDGCPHHGPAISAADEGYHLGWFTNGTRHQGVIYGYHDNASATTSRIHVLDPSPAGGHPALSVQGSEVTVFWNSYDGTQMQLKYAQSSDMGQHWQQTRILATSKGAADYPQTLVSGKMRYIAWQTTSDGYRLLPVPDQAGAAE